MSMKRVKLELSPLLFLPPNKPTGGFYPDIPPEHRVDAKGDFQPPLFLSLQPYGSQSTTTASKPLTSGFPPNALSHQHPDP